MDRRDLLRSASDARALENHDGTDRTDGRPHVCPACWTVFGAVSCRIWNPAVRPRANPQGGPKSRSPPCAPAITNPDLLAVTGHAFGGRQAPPGRWPNGRGDERVATHGEPSASSRRDDETGKFYWADGRVDTRHVYDVGPKSAVVQVPGPDRRHDAFRATGTIEDTARPFESSRR
jgi:hypothetical protein